MRAKATPRPDTARDSKIKTVGVRLLAVSTSTRGEGATRGRRDRRAVRLVPLALGPLVLSGRDLDGKCPFDLNGMPFHVSGGSGAWLAVTTGTALLLAVGAGVVAWSRCLPAVGGVLGAGL
jgi:hypothetical protein